MSNEQHPSKKVIRDRMSLLAEHVMNIPHAKSPDPVVLLLLESLSEEIYKLFEEIEHAEEHISDNLQNTLAYNPQTMAKSAHCILHAFPQKEIIEINPKTRFSHFSKKKNKSFSFYPVNRTRLFKAQISHFIFGNMIYSINRYFYKKPIVRLVEKDFNKRVFWIGLDVDEAIEDLFGMSFFLDLFGSSNKNEALNLLSQAKWEIEDLTLSISRDSFIKEEKSEHEITRLYSELDMLKTTNTSVKKQYENHFFTIRNNCDVRCRRTRFPKEIASILNQDPTNKMNKPLVWIKVTISDRFTSEMINSLQIIPNAFPAINKELVSKVTEINRMMPIIPLRTEKEEAFISVYQVSDSDGKVFHDISLRTGKADYGIYAIKKGGIERYDKNNMKEYLSNMVEMLINEVITYLPAGENEDEFHFREEINDVLRGLSYISERSAGNCEPNSYLLIDQKAERQAYFVDYWITNGSDANSIKKDALFHSEDVPISTAFSLTQTAGGNYALSKNKKKALRQKLLSRHYLLISNEDIQNFCLSEFNDSIQDVKVKNGYMQNPDFPTDFIRTTDVYLILHQNKGKYEKEKPYFEQMLQKNSPETYKYRIFIKEYGSEIT